MAFFCVFHVALSREDTRRSKGKICFYWNVRALLAAKTKGLDGRKSSRVMGEKNIQLKDSINDTEIHPVRDGENLERRQPLPKMAGDRGDCLRAIACSKDLQ